MVFMGNICKAHEELKEDEEIILRFDTDNSISIYKDDELIKANGDLHIIRDGCRVFVDTAFVKYITIRRRFL